MIYYVIIHLLILWVCYSIVILVNIRCMLKKWKVQRFTNKNSFLKHPKTHRTHLLLFRGNGTGTRQKINYIKSDYHMNNDFSSAHSQPDA